MAVELTHTSGSSEAGAPLPDKDDHHNHNLPSRVRLVPLAPGVQSNLRTESLGYGFSSILISLSDPKDGSWAHANCINKHVCGSKDMAQDAYDKLLAKGGDNRFVLPSGIHVVFQPYIPDEVMHQLAGMKIELGPGVMENMMEEVKRKYNLSTRHTHNHTRHEIAIPTLRR